MDGVGREIRRLRQAKGWTQQDLAFHARSSQPTVAFVESGRRNPSTGTLEKLAGALGVDVGDLFPKALALPFEELTAAPIGDLDRTASPEWEKAVRDAQSLREDGYRARVEELVEAWRESRERGESPNARAELLDQIGGLLQEAHEAERALWSAGADGIPGAPATDEYIHELQAASRFYGELCGRVENAGLRVRRGDRVDDLAA